jgi:hypothetical protein
MRLYVPEPVSVISPVQYRSPRRSYSWPRCSPPRSYWAPPQLPAQALWPEEACTSSPWS